MSQLSPDASALFMCFSAPRRALDLKTQVGWSEQRFNAALSQLVTSNQVEVFGGPGDQYLVRADDSFDDEEEGDAVSWRLT
jgi:hypothetical protein